MAVQTIETKTTEEFLGKVLSDTSAFTTIVLAAVGDRLGLYKELAARGPATSAELASRAGIAERYAREWLGAMASAGYLIYDPDDRRFSLPSQYSPIIAQEGAPYFFGGIHQMVLGMSKPVDRLIEAFKTGGGVTQSSYDDDMWDGLERFTNGWFENLLLQQWIPAMPLVEAKLKKGAQVADVGCGRGRALIKLAEAFPTSTYIGFDAFAPTIERARQNAADAGVGERIRFEARDCAQGLPATYDVITTFDVIHDAVDPAGLLKAIRRALKPDGVYVCLDINCSDRLEENAGPLGALFQGFSVLYCMTTSLAGHGEALGTVGVPESKLSELSTKAGFSSLRRVPLENPFNNLYELRP